MIEILFSDTYFTAVNKPSGMLVHRSSIAADNDPVVLQLLRQQLNRMVYPVHRLDRPTSGVVLFGHSPEITRKLQETLSQPQSKKIYHALVRGWISEAVVWNRDVKNDRGNLKLAETHFNPLEYFELPYPTDRYESARFTLVEAQPFTGRWHQLRQHLAQMRHYIINDRVHGDGKQNRLMSEQIGITEMFLHARKLELTHPVTTQNLIIEAPYPAHWEKFRSML